MDDPPHIFDVLRRHLEEPQITVGYFDRRARAFHVEPLAQTIAASAPLAEALIEGGTEVGEVVMLATGGPGPAWRGYLAAVLAGAVPVIVPVRPSFDSGQAIERKLVGAEQAFAKSTLLIETNDDQPIVDPRGRSWTALGPRGNAGDVERLLDRRERKADDPLHLQFTSGSTGDAKPVVLTTRNVISSIESLAERIELTRDDHFVSWLPLYHDMGLVSMALASLVGQAHLRLMSPFDFLSRPGDWLRAVADAPGSITAAPNFALDYTTRRARIDDIEELDLSTWKKCACGGEPVDPATLAAFIDRFRTYGLRPEVVHPTYGLAEATLMVAVPRVGELAKQVEVELGDLAAGRPVEVLSASTVEAIDPALPVSGARITCLGPVAKGLTVAIRSDNGRKLPENVCGEVFVQGAPVSPGYLDSTGRIEPFPPEGCPTGDIGFLRDGELYIVERSRNIMIRNGQNYAAATFEQHLARRLQLAPDGCAVLQDSLTSDRILAVVELGRRQNPDDVLEACRSAAVDLDLPIDELVLVGRNSIPLTTSGKKQHALLRAQLRSGDIEVIGRFTVGIGVESASSMVGNSGVIDLAAAERRQHVVGMVERHAARAGWPGGSMNDALHLTADLHLDSLAVIELLVEIEQELARPMDPDRIGSIETLGELLGAVERSFVAEAEVGPGLSRSLERLLSIPQTYQRVDEQRLRRLRVGDRWVTDLASLNYLGFDLHPDVIGAIRPAVDRWGVHPSWSRAVAEPALYGELEQALARLVGSPDTVLFPTVTLVHIGVLPLLATRSDSLILDRGSHHSLHEAAELVAARGASMRSFDHSDLTTLEHALVGCQGRPVIAMNGVFSMTGSVPDVAEIVRLSEPYDALIYLDDAHGFGLLGRRTGRDDPYGSGGGGLGVHLGLDYSRVIYVGGLSKAFSSMAAFVSCADQQQRALYERASTSIYSGPVPVASLATALAGLEVNQREGDDIRRHLHSLTCRAIEGVEARGYVVDNALRLPIVNLVLGDISSVVRASEILWEHGVLVTPSVFPVAPLDRGGFRISFTANNTVEDVDQFLAGLDAIRAVLDPTARHVAAVKSGSALA